MSAPPPHLSFPFTPSLSLQPAPFISVRSSALLPPVLSLNLPPPTPHPLFLAFIPFKRFAFRLLPGLGGKSETALATPPKKKKNLLVQAQQVRAILIGESMSFSPNVTDFDDTFRNFNNVAFNFSAHPKVINTDDLCKELASARQMKTDQTIMQMCNSDCCDAPSQHSPRIRMKCLPRSRVHLPTGGLVQRDISCVSTAVFRKI